MKPLPPTTADDEEEPQLTPLPPGLPTPVSWFASNLRPITVLGVPAIVMAFLVYWITTVVSMRLGRIEDAMIAHDRALAIATARLDAYLYSVCLGVAQTEVDRARCAIGRNPDVGPTR